MQKNNVHFVEPKKNHEYMLALSRLLFIILAVVFYVWAGYYVETAVEMNRETNLLKTTIEADLKANMVVIEGIHQDCTLYGNTATTTTEK